MAHIVVSRKGLGRPSTAFFLQTLTQGQKDESQRIKAPSLAGPPCLVHKGGSVGMTGGPTLSVEDLLLVFRFLDNGYLPDKTLYRHVRTSMRVGMQELAPSSAGSTIPDDIYAVRA